ncbi:hypothetical protein [uncultured Empedobacter sp.]|uniref:hypothetical protein n=1 Tax=uncultured Empedobacter sp. TaxID=410844 RepID=UPI0025DD43F8|nr:hypothetical protein [uncultured Empedobacter sp.]
MTEFEEKILKYMSHGLTIKEVSEKLKDENHEPSSQSMVEKTLQKIKKEHNIKTTFQLGYFVGQMEKKLNKK